MAKFKFIQADWKLLVLFPVIPLLFFSLLTSYFAPGLAMLLSVGITIVFIFLFSSFFTAEVEFRETYLLLKSGLTGKRIKVDYSQIDKVVFYYKRFLNLHIYTAGKKIQLPPPAKDEKAEALFQWLESKHPTIKLEIIK